MGQIFLFQDILCESYLKPLGGLCCVVFMQHIHLALHQFLCDGGQAMERQSKIDLQRKIRLTRNLKWIWLMDMV